MKKIAMVLLLVMLSVGLMACGDKETTSNDGETKVSTKDEPKQESEEESKEESNKDDAKVKESEIGKMTLAYKDEKINGDFKSGPMNLNVNALQIGTLEPSESYKEMFDGKDKLTVITLRMKAENTSDDTISFYPDQAIITTDAGDQIDASLILSDNVGGDFIGKVNKKGNVIFTLDTPASEIKTINMIVSGAMNAESFDSAGEEIKATFKVE